MPGTKQIQCMADAYNYMMVYVMGDYDIALVTERCNPHDDKDDAFMMSNPTLRTSRGGGRYDKTFTQDWQNEKTLWHYFYDFYNNALDDIQLPVIKEDIVLEETEILGFPSDDGRKPMGFELLNCKGLIGVQAIEDRQRKKIAVWLGNANELTLLQDFWNRGLATHQHYTKNFSGDGFYHLPKGVVV